MSLYVSITWGQINYPIEKSAILTDRAFYISGEEIQFSGVIYVDGSEDILSDVVYLELIDPLGNKVNQQKQYLKHGDFKGKILIPESTISGYYFLRVYTKWMRNFELDHADQLMLKIVNPFLMDVQQLPDSLYLNTKTSFKVGFIFDSSWPKTYKRKELITVDLSSLNLDPSNNLQLSVIPDGSQHFVKTEKKRKSNSIKRAHFYPETRNICLSGTILWNDNPSSYHMIYTNVMGEKDFQSVYSDSLGRFHISLPKNYGYKELMIGADYKYGDIQILIDSDFESDPSYEKVLKFGISESEEKLALQLTKQYQINKWYFDSISEYLHTKNAIPFYTEVSKTIDFDYYIPLDSTSQYFTDISSYVQIKRKNGKRYLQVFGAESSLLIYKPLLLVDWIPINDAERILAMNPSNIKKIDIINRLYFHGNRTYGGIIHVHTRDSNLADLRFPNSNIYLNYQFPKPEPVDHENLQFPGTHLNIVKPLNELAPLKFQAPQLAGKYVLLIQQINKKEEKIIYQIPFEVE